MVQVAILNQSCVVILGVMKSAHFFPQISNSDRDLLIEIYFNLTSGFSRYLVEFSRGIFVIITRGAKFVRPDNWTGIV